MDDAEIVALAARDRRGSRRECLDTAGGGAGGEPERKRHGHWIGPSRAVVRSNPNAMLKHSTPWPDAPLTRLSRAAVTTALWFCADTLTRQRLEWLPNFRAGACA